MGKVYFNNAPVYFLEDSDMDQDGKLGTTKPTLVMIMGSFCGHCNAAAPMFEEFAKKHPEILTAAVLTDGDASEKALSQRLDKFIPGIRGVPTFVLFKNGKYVKTHDGPRTVEALAQFAR
jgi:thiol-disulfide isomerase/thioredoxin